STAELSPLTYTTLFRSVTGLGGLSAAARCLCAGDDPHAEEAEFCAPQSGESAVDEWPGSDCLHSGRRTQFAGALDRARARRTRRSEEHTSELQSPYDLV